MSVRLRRLSNDFEELRQYAADQDRVLIRNTTGEPPEKYQIEYRIKGLEMKGGEVVERSSHLVEIVLPLEYPTMEPKCRMLTPVFHPNISPQVICHTDHWAAGESLVDVVVRIGEMISYQNYNIKSPRNGEAARWAEANMGRFPVDPVGLTGLGPQTDGGAPRPSEETAAVPEAGSSLPEGFACANCGAKGPAASFVECAEHHVACPDCALLCTGCGRPLCVLCSFSQCPSCKAVLCGECAMTHSPETDGLCVDRGGADQKPCAPAALDRPDPDGPERAASETSSVPSPAAPCGKCGHVSEYWNAAFCPCCGTKLQ
jgi:ubiquitin-protein ligase